MDKINAEFSNEKWDYIHLYMYTMYIIHICTVHAYSCHVTNQVFIFFLHLLKRFLLTKCQNKAIHVFFTKLKDYALCVSESVSTCK